MFGSRRKKGAPLPPLNATTANPNAATAALSAFKRRGSNGSNGSLSAAAAAAALKARPTTPINVADVQTKRTARRSASVSSAGTAPELGDRPGGSLERRGSSGSLTERTFRSRSQSPHRPSSSGGHPRSSLHTEEVPPPVPSIPKDVEARESAKAGKGKSLGFKSPPLRVASQKLGKEGSGSWFGSAKAGDPSNVRTSDAALANPPALEKEREGRPSSRGSSINFSYPARARLGSPPPDSPTIAEEEAKSQPAPAPAAAPPQPQPEVLKRTSKRASTLSPARGGGVRSPRPASIASDRELVYDPNSRRMVPRGDLLGVEQNVIEASERRPKKKKQVPSRAGSHLAQGTMGRPHGSAVDNGVDNEAQKAAAASLRSHRTEERHYVPEEEEEEEYEYEQPAMEVVPASPRQNRRKIVSPEPTRQGQRTSLSPASSAPEVYARQSQPTERRSSNQFLGRKPSMVREEEEPEVEELDSQAIAYQQPESPPQQRQEIHIMSPQPIAIPHAAPAELPAAPTPPPAGPPAVFRIDRGAVSQPEAIRRERAHSNSPARTAHFGPVQDSLTVRHSPPPRSISPRKSALKQQSPSRASPEDDTSEASGSGVQVQEPVLPRKKSVRVSFDDQNTVVVGEAATPEQSESPVLLSPQNSKRVPWYSSITRSKKKDIPSLDDDEVMQPRPALPSFGSVREKKQASKEPEERPLVRPVEGAQSPSLPASPALNPSIASVTEAEPVGQSSDHAIGALLQEQGPRTEANISKLREPLPPVVTSIEGSGYLSDTSSSSDSESELIADTPRLEPEMSQASTLITEPESQPPPLNGSAEVSEVPAQAIKVEAKDFAEDEPRGPLPEPIKTPERAVPSIAITQPSPRLPDGKTPPRDYLDVPGGFPDTDSEMEEPPKPLDPQTVVSQSEEPSTPVRKVTFEPVIQKDDMRAASQTASTALATTIPIIQDNDDSDSSGVYSDAYEDLSDIEGDGFQSLDAVVESPLITTPPQSAFAKARAAQMQGESPTPSPRPADDKPLALAPEVLQPAQTPPDDWEVAKAYWRSLTADKRAQLEKEAVEDAGVEGDLEEVQQEDKKPRRKKSVEKRVAEKKVIEEQRAVDPQRTYMIKPGTRVEADTYTSAPVKTMRKQQQATAPAGQPATRMRKSMRGAEQPQSRAGPAVGASAGAGAGGAPRIRKSMRTNGPEPQQRPAAAQSARPVSYQPASSTPRQAQKHKRSMSDQSYQSSQASALAAAGVSKALQPKLTRRGSDSSESSFKRARTRPGEGFGFRRTMRGQGHEPSNSQDSGRPSSSRFSLRSLSPTGSPFRRSSTVDSPPVSMGNRMKTSMRGQAEPQRKGSRLSSLGFSSSKPKVAPKTRKASRFGDSSDEDEPPRQGFRSRFDDSSDEEDVPERLPPLAIPKNARGNIAATRTSIPASQTLHEEDEQSSDLPDSDEESKRPQRTASGRQAAQGTGTVRRSGSGRGALVSSPTSPVSPGTGGRPAAGQNRRSSFMSALRRKKPDGAGKISRGEVMDSAARRDTTLERSTSELNAIRTNNQRGQTASSPKLQKRTASFPAPPARNGSWPLPDEEEDDEEPELPAAGVDEEKHLQRPSTSGNLEATTTASRPGFLQRRTMSTQGTIDTHGVGGEKKKKKFGALRRMFKLDD